MHPEVAQPLDPALVRRLSRPAVRPGVIDQGPARAMLARHRRMVAELPLAELVSRHTGSVQNIEAAVPIAYALPAQPPPTPDSGPSEAGPGPSVSRPIVPARLAQRATHPAQPAHSAHAHTAVPAAHNSTPSLVVQRQVAAPPAPAMSASDGAGSVLPTSSHPGLRALDLPPLDLRMPNGGRHDFMPADLGPPRFTTQAGSRRVVPTVVVPAEPGGVPPVRADRNGTPLVVARPASHPELAHSEFGHPESGGLGGAVVVAADRPHSRPGEPLLLVDLAVASARPAGEHPVAAGQRETPEPVGRRVSRAGQVQLPEHSAGAAQGAARSTVHATQGRQEAVPIDIARIVDMVHSRFVRKLAVEAERRAVR